MNLFAVEGPRSPSRANGIAVVAMATSIDYSDRLSSDVAKKAKLLSQVTCPHCWERFQPEQVLWISEHVDLLGDPLLGPEQEQRFLPSRFTLDGDAIDARGMTCRALACPRCHLPVPRAMLEMEPLSVRPDAGPPVSSCLPRQ